VVDDEPKIAGLLCAKLSAEGFECQECYSVEQALEFLAREDFDSSCQTSACRDVRAETQPWFTEISRSALVLRLPKMNIHISVSGP